MNNTEFYAHLAKLADGAPANVKLAHAWQFAAALTVCPDGAAAVALTVANSKLAEQYANQEAVYEALCAPNVLHAALAAVGSNDEALAIIGEAPADVRAEYADDLALAEYNQEQLCGQYRQLVLGESQ